MARFINSPEIISPSNKSKYFLSFFKSSHEKPLCLLTLYLTGYVLTLRINLVCDPLCLRIFFIVSTSFRSVVPQKQKAKSKPYFSNTPLIIFCWDIANVFFSKKIRIKPPKNIHGIKLEITNNFLYLAEVRSVIIFNLIQIYSCIFS